jgi:hypothetical protein
LGRVDKELESSDEVRSAFMPYAKGVSGIQTDSGADLSRIGFMAVTAPRQYGTDQAG